MKIAVVTGASSGMGREAVFQIADRFQGLDEIWVIARRKERLEELERKMPGKIRCFTLDLTKDEALKTLEETLKEVRPDIKFLINSAGFGKIGFVGDVSMESETGMVRLNCETLCAVTHIVLPYLSRNSRIIQFASSAAFLPQPKFAIYAATKAFVLSYSRALGAELRHKGIYVTAVCPGPVATEFFDIAETTGHVAFYKHLVMASPKKVVKLAIRDSMMGKSVSIYGGVMKAFYVMCKIVPHDWMMLFLTNEKHE